tara:strand:- start:897 stop:2003 length:1107 start_codon:yes stop_codon:yes gene_type:complete
VYDYLALKKSEKMVTFYSEGKNYWPYLRGIVEYLIRNTNVSIYYVTSDEEDPGLLLREKNYKTLIIDDGFMRDFFFKNLNTYILITTMPDLDIYQVKKSQKTSYYIYTQHSLMSPNCSYRKGSFDNYDIIFCSGQYMIDEIRKNEEFHDLPEKILVKHGYTIIDNLIREFEIFKNANRINNKTKKILLAPSWNDKGLIESGMSEDIIKLIISEGYHLTLRPHPQTLKISPQKINSLLEKYSGNASFCYEPNILSNDNLFKCDALITDWSGIALEYAFVVKKPILFVDTPQKILNDDYEQLNTIAFEKKIREKIGVIWDCKTPITDLISNFNKQNNASDYVFNIGKSDEIAANYIKNLINKFSERESFI